MTLANIVARMEPTGRANARPMTGSAKSGTHATSVPDFAALHPGYSRVICPSGCFLTGVSSLISDFPKNIFVPTHPKSDLELWPSHPTRGAYRDRHGRGMGCGGRGSVLRATGSQGGLAKACERSNGVRTREVAA